MNNKKNEETKDKKINRLEIENTHLKAELEYSKNGSSKLVKESLSDNKANR